jgi:hypothetical protein
MLHLLKTSACFSTGHYACKNKQVQLQSHATFKFAISDVIDRTPQNMRAKHWFACLSYVLSWFNLNIVERIHTLTSDKQVSRRLDIFFQLSSGLITRGKFVGDFNMHLLNKR